MPEPSDPHLRLGCFVALAFVVVANAVIVGPMVAEWLELVGHSCQGCGPPPFRIP